MKQANRLILNTLVTYGRMVLTVGIGLATTRLVLSTLGTVDFGIFSVLGGGLSLIMLVSAALADAAQRHLAFEIGRDDQQALREVFCTAAVIYLALGVFIAGLGLALRPVFLHGLTIPDDRLDAAGWVYDLTLLNLALSVLVTPFLAVFLARQALVQDAVFAVLASVAGLLAIFFTPYVHHDALIGYVVLFVAASLLLKALQILRGLILFPETRFRPAYFRKHRVRELVGFAGWSFVGSVAWQSRTQGGNILLNLFFGPVVNASYAVALQAVAYMTNFSGAITNAARPAMTSLEGAGRRDDLRRLALTVSKLTALGSSFVAVPIILEPQAVLMLWLGRVPPYADSFVPIMMAWMMIFQLTAGHALANAALGDIGRVVRISAFITIAPLPLGWLLFMTTDLTPPWYAVLALVSTLGLTLFRVPFIGHMVGIKSQTWLANVVSRVMFSMLPGLAAAVGLQMLMPAGLLPRLMAIAAAYAACTAATAVLVGFMPEEKHFFGRFLKSTVAFIKPQKTKPAHASAD